MVIVAMGIVTVLSMAVDGEADASRELFASEAVPPAEEVGVSGVATSGGVVKVVNVVLGVTAAAVEFDKLSAVVWAAAVVGVFEDGSRFPRLTLLANEGGIAPVSVAVDGDAAAVVVMAVVVEGAALSGSFIVYWKKTLEVDAVPDAAAGKVSVKAADADAPVASSLGSWNPSCTRFCLAKSLSLLDGSRLKMRPASDGTANSNGNMNAGRCMFA